MEEKNKGIEEEIVVLDAGWEEYLAELSASTFGLTPEQFMAWNKFKTFEEKDAYLREHSTFEWDENGYMIQPE